MSWFKVGAHVMAHGVNDDYIGEVVAILPGRVVELKDASWIADSGLLGDFVKDGTADGMELEFIGNKLVHWEDISEWPHDLPKESVRP